MNQESRMQDRSSERSPGMRCAYVLAILVGTELSAWADDWKEGGAAIAEAQARLASCDSLAAKVRVDDWTDDPSAGFAVKARATRAGFEFKTSMYGSGRWAYWSDEYWRVRGRGCAAIGVRLFGTHGDRVYSVQALSSNDRPPTEKQVRSLLRMDFPVHAAKPERPASSLGRLLVSGEACKTATWHSRGDWKISERAFPIQPEHRGAVPEQVMTLWSRPQLHTLAGYSPPGDEEGRPVDALLALGADPAKQTLAFAPLREVMRVGKYRVMMAASQARRGGAAVLVRTRDWYRWVFVSPSACSEGEIAWIGHLGTIAIGRDKELHYFALDVQTGAVRFLDFGGAPRRLRVVRESGEVVVDFERHSLRIAARQLAAAMAEAKSPTAAPDTNR